MSEQFLREIPQNKLLYYFTEELGYTEQRAEQTILALQKLNPRIQEAFLNWFYASELPKEPLFGVSVADLCKRRHLDPVTAFLTVDWISREPEEAKKALSSGYDLLDT